MFAYSYPELRHRKCLAATAHLMALKKRPVRSATAQHDGTSKKVIKLETNLLSDHVELLLASALRLAIAGENGLTARRFAYHE